MKPAPFAYVAPTSMEETLDLLSEFGADARVIAGGQTLGPMLNMRIATPGVLVDINRVHNFPQLTIGNGRLRTGALVRQREAHEHDDLAQALPLMRTALSHVGHYQTRTRGTLCGSIAHADPTAELPLVLLTLGGSVLLASKRRRRTVAAAEFFQGSLMTAREPGELVVAADWPVWPAPTRYSFEEVSVRHGHIAVVACAACARLQPRGIAALAIGLTGISDRPILIDTKSFLGAPLDASWQAAVVEHARASVTYIDDLHASAVYRRHVAGWLIERALTRVIATGAGEDS